MDTNGYVSRETALKLKEKGFNVPVRTFYNPKYKGQKISHGTALINYNADPKDGSALCSAPTLQMANKFLRERYNIFIQVELYSKNGDFTYEIFKNTHRMDIKREVFPTPEEAMRAAIDTCIDAII